MYEVFLLIIALAWLIFASVSDIKTHEVPDWLSYSLIAIGLTSALLNSLIFYEIKFLIHSLFSFGSFFLFSLLLYYTRQWGGGDVKLLAALIALFPIYPEELLYYLNPNLDLPFILILILNIVIFGALYSLIYGIYLIKKNKVNLIKEIKNYKLNKIYILIPLIILTISFLIQDLILKLFFLSLGIIILITPFLLIYVKIIEKRCMLKKININKLTEGDWITENIYYKGKLVYNKNSTGIIKEQISLLKKIRIKTVIIKEGIPFVPVFLISFIITITFGNLIRI